MGFHVGDTRAPGLTEDERNHLLGQCIDRNLLTWLVRQLHSPMLPQLRGPQPPPCSPTH